MTKRFDVIGKPRRRVDGRAKVTGLTRFADDVVLPRMLHCKLLRSPHPHATIESIDVSRAQARPGVHLVLTGKDFPVTFGILPVTQDEYPLAPERVRYVGDPVAAVVARDDSVGRNVRNGRRAPSRGDGQGRARHTGVVGAGGSCASLLLVRKRPGPESGERARWNPPKQR